MTKLDSFYHECYQILRQEKPEVVFEVAELLSVGSTPSQIRTNISKAIQNPSSTLPLMAENAALYLRGVVALKCRNSIQLNH